MSLVCEESVNLQLSKFNEILQRIIMKTDVIIQDLIRSDSYIRSKYSDIPMLLKIALSVIQGETTIPQFDRIYTPIKLFMKKYFQAKADGINLFDLIDRKDDSILTEHLSAIFPESNYVDKIQYIYGANPKKKRYVSDEDVQFMWKLITAAMHRAIKWVILSGDDEYISRLPADVLERYRIRIEG